MLLLTLGSNQSGRTTQTTSTIMSKAPVIIITGSSSGIGLGLALALAKKPYTVIATLRKPQQADPELRATNCDIQPLDVTCDESVARLAAYVKEKYGGCDIVINNAGFFIPGCVEAVSIDDAKRMFDVNVWGVMRMCQAFSPQMRARGGGLIMVVASTMSIYGGPTSDTYVGSKRAIETMMESYRYVVEQDNIKVVLINPGATRTYWSARGIDERKLALASDPYKELTQRWLDGIDRRVNEGQTVEECALCILETLEREFPKDVTNGTENVRFWNPTAAESAKKINSILKNPDGYSGAYADIFTRVRELVRSIKSEKSEKLTQGSFS